MPGVGTRTSLAARGTTLHQLVDNDTTDSSDPTALSYRTCSANCTQAASWQELPNMFVYDGDKSTQIAVTEQGQVRIVYNQGQSPANQPAAVQAQNQKMLFWGCDANCLQAASWKGFVMGAEGDGAEGIQMVEQGGALVLSITNTSAVRTRFCTSDCLVDSNWQEAVVDSTAPLYDQLNPLDLVSSTCGIGLKPVNATWHVAHGVVAIRPDGALAFAHSTHILRTCPNSSAVTYFPGYGRLVFVE
jgi:hypothetical protein